MRDIAILLIYLPLIALALTNPFIGALFYYLVSIAALHELAFGFARTVPWAYIAAGVGLLSWLIAQEKPKFVWNRTIALFLLWGLWIQVTTYLALNPIQGEPLWEKFMKIWIAAMFFVMFFNTRQRIVGIIAVIAGSIGFYGAKGGYHALQGTMELLGPSSLEDRNDFALGCVIVLPLLWYLRSQVPKAWQGHLITAVCALTLLAVLFTLSRGAFLALLALGGLLWWKAHRKILLLFAATGILVILAAALPPEFYDRMSTIDKYQDDSSAQGRLAAWQHAINVAMARPVIGGGMGTFRLVVYTKFTPNAPKALEAHSIYFQALGDQGFVGLAIFLSILIVAYWNARWLQRRTRDRPDLKWATDLGFYSQLSLIGYATGGTFLSLAYLELPYVLMLAIAMARHVVEKSLAPAPAAMSLDLAAVTGLRPPSVLAVPQGSQLPGHSHSPQTL